MKQFYCRLHDCDGKKVAVEGLPSKNRLEMHFSNVHGLHVEIEDVCKLKKHDRTTSSCKDEQLKKDALHFLDLYNGKDGVLQIALEHADVFVAGYVQGVKETERRQATRNKPGKKISSCKEGTSNHPIDLCNPTPIKASEEPVANGDNAQNVDSKGKGVATSPTAMDNFSKLVDEEECTQAGQRGLQGEGNHKEAGSSFRSGKRAKRQHDNVVVRRSTRLIK